ncbi:uncharacterized protein LOC121855531 [Homarus americanus]|uniref:Uncharacterized protein n=1 Tax=Homarus americanus TaxID=6706 RepID=A0A8J5MKS9_HOMAM|nr:uncharacterized protein LOC121855531 [Homarus americanus]KAG7155046.1 hypothetical protein Hamer_G015648 [Homarus americanus]
MSDPTQLLLQRGIGAILSSLGGGKLKGGQAAELKKTPPKAKVPRKIPQPQKQPQKQEQQQGFDLDTTVEFSGWEDISSHQNIGFQGEYTKDDCDSRAGKSVEEKIEAPPEEPNNKNEGQAGRRQDPPPRRGRSDRPRPSQGRSPPHPRGHYESRDRSGYGGRMGSAGRDYNRYYDNYDDYDRRSPYGGGRYDRGRYDRSNVPYSDRQTYDDLHYRSRADSDPYPYERNKRRTPPPPRISSTQKTLPAVPLPPLDAPVRGPTGTLLKQLSDCEVRDEKDVDLASDVITMLLKGLSDFHRKQGSSSSVHLISEAQIKFDIMKELINVPNPEVSTWM